MYMYNLFTFSLPLIYPFSSKVCSLIILVLVLKYSPDPLSLSSADENNKKLQIIKMVQLSRKHALIDTLQKIMLPYIF